MGWPKAGETGLGQAKRGAKIGYRDREKWRRQIACEALESNVTALRATPVVKSCTGRLERNQRIVDAFPRYDVKFSW
jgi:hypothetical protein